MLFRASRKVSFFIFSQGCTQYGGTPNTYNMSNIFKVSNKDTRTTFGAYIANFEQIKPFILLLLLVNTNK